MALTKQDADALRPVFERWRANPTQFVVEALRATPEPWQAEALDAINLHDRIAVRSGHGVGKSTWLAWVILWWMLTRFPAKVPCTAPTAHQLEDVLWGELSKWYRRLPELLQSWLILKGDRLELADHPAESFAVARTARKEQPEAFQGFHSQNLLFIADEASGIEDIIFEVGEGAMSTPGAKTLLTGNPTRTSGYFFDAFNRDRARWHTKRVECGESSHVSPGYMADMLAKYGEESNIYRVRVLGEFPLSDDDVVIPLHLVESAIDRDVGRTLYRQVWGLDVARFGEDRSCLVKRQGNRYISHKVWNSRDTMQTAGIVANEYKISDAADRPSEILVDVIGIGAGVVDRMYELGLPVRGINVGESPAAQDGRFIRLRDELWWRAREWFEKRDVSMSPDDDLIAELTSVKYKFTSAGKIQIESKDEMKKRGLRSPDIADAFVLTMAAAQETGSERQQDRYSSKPTKGKSWMTA